MHRDTHLGHALNKVLKSIIVQYKVLRGARPRYVPGWDCHGLPIELKVLQGLSPEQRRELTPIALRRKARDFALKTMKAQREQFRRLQPHPPSPAVACPPLSCFGGPFWVLQVLGSTVSGTLLTAYPGQFRVNHFVQLEG